MAREVSIEEYERIRASGIDPKTEAEIEAALSGDVEQYHAEALDMYHVPYEFGGVEFSPIRGTTLLFALDAIHSPFLDSEAAEASLLDVAKALYVLALGRKAIEPLLTLDRRRQAMARERALAESSPAHYERYLARVDRIECDSAQFDEKVLEFWEQFEGVTIDDATRFIFEMVQNAAGGFGMLPAGNNEKKKDG